ncbi:MAG: TetR/AcrR family transcriptional regulator, partial [Pedobacter sp.]
MSKAERTKSFIIEKTASIFNKKGFAGTSLNDMTAATGLTKGSIYGNFANKDEVAIAVFDYNLQKLNACVAAQFSKQKTAKDKLMVYVNNYEEIFNSSCDDGGCPILNTATDADDTCTYKRVFQALCEIFLKYFSVNFSAVELGCASGTGTCSVTPATPLNVGTTYNWNVKANNSVGFSAASNSLITTVNLSPPNIVAPTTISPSGSINAVNPPFTWNASAGATGYLLSITTGATAYFAANYSAGELGCASGSGICSANPTMPLVAGVNYSWSVKALNTAGSSAASASKSVIVNAVSSDIKPAPLAFNEQPFGELQLVDTIDTATQAPWEEDVAGPSNVQTLLGQKARTLAPGLEPLTGGARFMTYRIGAGKGLIPHQAYVLDIEYPDDVPRSMFIANRGADFIRGFATGMALGDARNAYSVGTVESLSYPQTQTWKHYQSLF